MLFVEHLMQEVNVMGYRITKCLQGMNKLFFQKPLILYRKRMFDLSDLSIISSDCAGGVLCHDYGIQFNSPTVNMIIDDMDFVKFCRNLKHYINQPLKKFEAESLYPISYCDDIKIIGLHYHSFDELEKAWNRRKKRINFDNILYVMTERQIKSKTTFEEFQKIDGKKLVFASLEYPEKSDNIIKVEKFDKMFLFNGISGRRNLETNFNFGKWISD